MKNMIEICKDFGIEIPADKYAEFNKAVAENYKTVAEHEKKVNRLTADLETEKKRADTAVETLKGFEGKDFDAITRERDKWKHDYEAAVTNHQKEQEEREFNSVLETAIAEAKGRNIKAIRANLDIEKLRGSRNQEKDIKSALDALRAESGYLFEDNGGVPRFTDPKVNGGNNGGSANMTKKEIMSVRDPVQRQKLIGEHRHLFV